MKHYIHYLPNCERSERVHLAMKPNNRYVIIAAGALSVLLIAGWGGGGEVTPANVGNVTGYVVAVVSGEGIGNMMITIGGKQGVSAVPRGDFAVKNIPTGTHNIIVTPSGLFAVVGELPPVTVAKNGTTPLPAPILVAAPLSVPPTTPESSNAGPPNWAKSRAARIQGSACCTSTGCWGDYCGFPPGLGGR